MAPWYDRAGRLSLLKLFVFIGLFLPAAWLAGLALTHDLGARPLNTAIHFAGLWMVRFLLITLAITPARKLFRWAPLILVRRMLGVAAFAYGLLHLGLYVVDQNWDLIRVVSEIWLRIYLTIGFVALFGLMLLAITSTDGWVRRLGGKRWQALHRIVYPVSVLALIHFFMQSKLNVSDAALMSGFFLWLMGYRLWDRFGEIGNIPSLLGLAGLSAVATALTEAGWYAVATHAPALKVVEANLGFAAGIRPAWWVLIVALGVTLAVTLRRALMKKTQSRAAPKLALDRAS
jgi:sulfoxide reductase heme-binding subunit YedZ